MYYLEESMVLFNDNLGMQANTSAKGDLLKIDMTSKALNEDK